MRIIRLVLVCLLLPFLLNAQTVRINEFSQGANNNKEWVELVVLSSSPVNFTNCVLSFVNISGWILDDNNGDFSPTNHFTGTGIAGGHMRFKNQSPWTSIPVGSIVLIYNAADKDIVTPFPADDALDLNSDCVYVLPSNHSSLEYCTLSPLATNCTTRTNYGTCTYGTAGGWTTVGLANAGDAMQIRNPSYSLIHGVVYGKSTSVSGCTTTPDMVGTSLAPLITTVNMGGLSAAFNGSSDADYFNAGSWIVQSSTLATPGAFNNATNQNLIFNTFRGGCTCNRILPFEESVIITRSRDNEMSVKLVGESIVTNTNNYIYNQVILVYDGSGKQISSTKRIVKGYSEYHLKELSNRGIYFVKVLVDDEKYSNFTFKIIR